MVFNFPDVSDACSFSHACPVGGPVKKSERVVASSPSPQVADDDFPDASAMNQHMMYTRGDVEYVRLSCCFPPACPV